MDIIQSNGVLATPPSFIIVVVEAFSQFYNYVFELLLQNEKSPQKNLISCSDWAAGILAIVWAERPIRCIKPRHGPNKFLMVSLVPGVSRKMKLGTTEGRKLPTVWIYKITNNIKRIYCLLLNIIMETESNMNGKEVVGVANKQSIRWTDFGLRFLAFVLTLVAAIVLGVDKQTELVQGKNKRPFPNNHSLGPHHGGAAILRCRSRHRHRPRWIQRELPCSVEQGV
ncbi:hypothetical protein RND71_007950 [Anisodus tanguticus]|uniref:Uncharacterized protein n=1 Tax=Anisodus tanguticus TaxID=243964 RepID=A0AAE1VQ76_9SOLA|nr:hypothetical protein RND71_007950 [Anisodus tanguticus]